MCCVWVVKLIGVCSIFGFVFLESDSNSFVLGGVDGFHLRGRESAPCLSIVNQFAAEHGFNQVLFLIIPISVVALSRGFHNHRKILISGLGCFGVVMILIGGTIIHNQYSALTDSLITISGSVILALAHFLNNRTDHHHSVSCK